MKGKFLLFFSLIIWAGCVSSIKEVKDPNTPFERRGYSILPPGSDWRYIEGKRTGGSNLSFGKKFDSSTHTLTANVVEVQSFANFSSPEEFLGFIKKGNELGTDPNRFRIQENEINLDDKFGAYSVEYYSKLEDHRAVNRGEATFLIMVTKGYTFIHPHFKDTIISVYYSERGRPDEIDPNFKGAAQKFIEGLRIKEDDSSIKK